MNYQSNVHYNRFNTLTLLEFSPNSSLEGIYFYMASLSVYRYVFIIIKQTEADVNKLITRKR